MPSKIGKLTCLKILSTFVVDSKMSDATKKPGRKIAHVPDLELTAEKIYFRGDFSGWKKEVHLMHHNTPIVDNVMAFELYL
ncbi:hypothetical protein P8452_55267 [Trifolium repens]|nr:hypothetical protein P8452_55267 [Trifolium repens]